MIKFGIYPRNKGRERFKIEGMFKNLFKNIVFFLVFWLNSRVKEGIWGQNGKIGGVLTIQGQTVKIPLQSPGKLSIFLVLYLFSTCPSLKSLKPSPIKIIFSKLTRTDLLLHKV